MAYTKLHPKHEAIYLAEIERGASRTAAAAAAGVTDRAVRNWLTRGEAGDERWAEFARKVRKAEGAIEAEAVAMLRAHGEKDWRALAWWLERRFPLQWAEAKGQQAKLDQERESMLETLVRVLEKRGLGEAAEEVVRELAGDSSEAVGSNQGAVGATH